MTTTTQTTEETMTTKMTRHATFESIQSALGRFASRARVVVDETTRTVEITDDPLSGETASDCATDLREAGQIE